MTDEPKEPRRAPTREEVRDLLRTFTCAVVEGESLYSNTPLPERRKQFDASREALLAAFDDMSRRFDALAAERDAAMALVRDLRDPSPCDHFDHHGYCQTHGWMETDPPCPHGRATKLLEALGEK